MRVVEIFDSIDGEGKRTGQGATFIRLAGCNLRCSYCDTLYALYGEKEPCVYEEMSVQDILQRVNTNFKRVTLTGGEPLIHPNVDELVRELLKMGVEVNIETNGAADISAMNALRAELKAQGYAENQLFLTIDYKLISSGESGKMLWSNFEQLREFDVVKFVVGSDADFDLMVSTAQKMSEIYTKMPLIYTGVVFGAYEPRKLVERMLAEPALKDAFCQMQIHKIIWNPEERGV